MHPSQTWLLAALLFEGLACAQSTSSSTPSTSSASTSTSTSSTTSSSSSSTPTNNPAVPGVMDYVSCVFVEDRDTSLQLVDSGILVEPRRCQNTCATLGRQYALLQGNNCYCNVQGVDLVFLVIADQDLCSDRCSGDPSSTCGSVRNQRDSLYQRVPDPSSTTTASSPTGSSTSSAPTSTASVTRNPELSGVMRYVGCVAIPAPEVDFLIVQFDSQVEPLGCQRQCADRGDRFAALLGQSCSCNRTADPRITYTDVESNCNIDCAGNGAYKCGGNLGFGQTYYSLYERDVLSGTNSSSISTSSSSTSSTATGSSIGVNGSSTTTGLTSWLSNSVTLSTASTTSSSSSIFISTTSSPSSSSGTALSSAPSNSSTSQTSDTIVTTSTSSGSSSSGTSSPATSNPPGGSASTSPSAPSGSSSSQVPVSIASTSTLSGIPSSSGTLSSATTSPTTSSSAPLSSLPSSGVPSPTSLSSISGISPASTVPSSGTTTTSNTATSLIPIPSMSAFVNVPIFLNIQGFGGGGPPEATPA